MLSLRPADPVTDFVAPTTVIDSPVASDVLVAGPVVLSGTATDDASGISRVRISVRDRDTLLWLQADGTFGTDFALVEATLLNPGGLTTGWTLDVDLPVGRYAMTARSDDAVGNGEAGWPRTVFEAA